MHKNLRFQATHYWWLLIAASCVFSLGCGLLGKPPPLPPPNDSQPRSEVAVLARDAARQYFRSVAANYATLSHEKFATVTEAMRRNVELDVQAREQYGTSLKAIMQSRVAKEGQDDALSEQAAEIFQQMSHGFAEAIGSEVTP